jgi:hypothetical protein
MAIPINIRYIIAMAIPINIRCIIAMAIPINIDKYTINNT